MSWTVFEYMYRDAGNFKAYGSVAFEGVLPSDKLDWVRARFQPDDLFIAEQIGVPPLYEDLYRWSGGPTASDHCWHEFMNIRVTDDGDVPPAAHRGGPVQTFAARLASVDTWDCELSPHFMLNA